MNKDEQRIAIAEFLGWENIGWQPRNCFDEATDRALGNTKDWYRLASENTVAMQDDLPCYLNDLNAMNVAVMSLTQRQKNDFVNLLDDLIEAEKQPDRDFEWCNATAAQRAEAFLRVIGKWRD